MLRNVFLYGKLEEDFGSVWSLDVESIAEAAHAININTNGKFGKAIRNMSLDIARGEDLIKGEKLDESLIQFNYQKGDFHIAPAAEGAGGAAVIGAILVASLIAGAIVAFSMPTTVSPEDNFENDEKGYTFSGVRSTDVQGSPIPLIYGEVYTGSVVISQGIKVEEVAS